MLPCAPLSQISNDIINQEENEISNDIINQQENEMSAFYIHLMKFVSRVKKSLLSKCGFQILQ